MVSEVEYNDKTIQNETQKKRQKKGKQKINELWDNFKQPNIPDSMDLEIPEEKREWEKIFNKIVKNCSSFMTTINPQIQEA